MIEIDTEPIEKLIIERKSIKDLAASIRDGRYQEHHIDYQKTLFQIII